MKAKKTSLLLAIWLGIFIASMQFVGADNLSSTAETKALTFLAREVPKWKRENGCFSCHNNGDAARALFAAIRKGHRVSADAFAETNAWLRAPHRWAENKGDPGFSDKRLANLQFAAALAAAITAGQIKEPEPLRQAARQLINDQSADGSWQIDAAGTVGSPATWGTPLATWMAMQTLRQANLSEAKDAMQKAERWLQQTRPNTVLTASTLVLAFARNSGEVARRKADEGLQLLRRAQTRDGGWGPYPDAPPESFDTALVLLALQAARPDAGIAAQIQRGRAFLIAQQNTDGSWPATTRPSGGDSYAQMMSTTGWATLALLETKG
jgi:Squalene-hopene cyclase C-terminal domain